MTGPSSTQGAAIRGSCWVGLPTRRAIFVPARLLSSSSLCLGRRVVCVHGLGDCYIEPRRDTMLVLGGPIGKYELTHLSQLLQARSWMKERRGSKLATLQSVAAHGIEASIVESDRMSFVTVGHDMTERKPKAPKDPRDSTEPKRPIMGGIHRQARGDAVVFGPARSDETLRKLASVMLLLDARSNEP